MGTRAEGAELMLTVLPIVMQCLECGAEETSREFPSPCPVCASADAVLKSGTEELRFEEMEVDTECA